MLPQAQGLEGCEVESAAAAAKWEEGRSSGCMTAGMPLEAERKYAGQLRVPGSLSG